MSPLLLSLKIALLATIINAVLGIALGAFLATRKFPGREWVDAIATAPLVLPPTVLGYYLLVVFGRSSALGRAFESLTGDSLVFTQSGAIVAAAISSVPLVVKTARAAIESVEPKLVQIARSLGATPTQALLQIQIPLAQKGLIAALTIGFARAMGDFGATLMVAGNIPGETRTAALFVYNAMAGGNDSAAQAMAASLAVLSIVCIYAVNRLTRRES